MSLNAGQYGEIPPAASIARAADMLNSEVGPEGTVEIFELFVQDANARAQDTDRACQARDALELRRAAHSFASVCRTVGADGFAFIFEKLERSALASDFVSAQAFVEQVYQQLPQVLSLVGAEVERLRKDIP